MNMPPDLIFDASTLARLREPGWDGWIGQLLASGRAKLSLPEKDAQVVRDELCARFLDACSVEKAWDLDSLVEPAVCVLFDERGLSRASSYPWARRAVALCGPSLNRDAIAKALNFGATHFLCDRLPDELGVDFRDRVYREWLRRFVFVPPSVHMDGTRGPSRAPRAAENEVLFAFTGDSGVGSVGAMEAFRMVCDAFGVRARDVRDVASLRDEALADQMNRLVSALILAAEPQVAHRLFLVGSALDLDVVLSPELVFSPFRFRVINPASAWLTPGPASGPLRRVHTQLSAFLRRSASVRSMATGGARRIETLSSSEVAEHVVSALGLPASSAAAGNGFGPWHAGPAWDGWAENASATPSERRAEVPPVSKLLKHPGIPALLSQIPPEARSRANNCLWLDYSISARQSFLDPDLAAVLRNCPEWVDVCQTAFSRARTLDPTLSDLRGPLAMGLTRCWAWDPENANALSVPVQIIRWLEADAAEGQQTPAMALELALAHARWGSFSTARSLASACGLDPQSEAITRIVLARLEGFREEHLRVAKRRVFRPVLEELRAAVVDALLQDPGSFEAGKIACFLDIFLENAPEAIRRLEQPMEGRAWPVISIVEIAWQLVFSGWAAEARIAGEMVRSRFAELRNPRERALTAALFRLLGSSRESAAVYEDLSEGAPDFFAPADPYSLRGRALVLAFEGEWATAREMFGRAIALRPALRSSAPLLDEVLQRIRPGAPCMFSDFINEPK